MALMRLARGFFRLTFAIVFAVTSLAHGPVMATQIIAGQLPCHDAPKAAPAPTHHAAGHAQHHGNADSVAAVDEILSPNLAQRPVDAMKVCPMPGCFLMAMPALATPPLPLATEAELSIKPSQPPADRAPDPADPPPRLQV